MKGITMKKTTFNKHARKLMALLLSVVMVAGVAACAKKEKKEKEIEVDLSEYIKLTVDGRDGEGSASFVFDYETLMEDLFDDEDRGEFFEDEEDDLTELLEDMTIELSKTYSLSNGDTLSYEVEYDEDDAEDLKIVFLDLSDITVEGLEVRKDYNPFDDVTVTYSGISPYVEVEVEFHCSLDDQLYVEFETDKQYYAKGETVVVTASYDEYDAEEYAYVNITATQTEYVAEAEYEYVLDASQITDKQEIYDYIYTEVQDYVTAEMSSDASRYYFGLDLSEIYGIYEIDYNTVEPGGDIAIDSVYLLTSKPGTEDDHKNMNDLIIIFKVPVVYPDIDPATVHEAYMYAVLPNIQLDADGNIFVSYSDLYVGSEYIMTRINAFDALVTSNANNFEAAEIPVSDIPAFPSSAVEPEATDTTPSETTAAE